MVPGVRYDSYSMDADENDAIYIATQSPPAADFSADRCRRDWGRRSSLNDKVTLHGQYAGGFRAPPYSAINSGFTNLQAATPRSRIPSWAPRPATTPSWACAPPSAGSASASPGSGNFYDDFIQQVEKGVNPATGLLEFQYQNLSEVEILVVSSSAPRPGSAIRSACAAPTPTSRATTSPATSRSIPSRRTRA